MSTEARLYSSDLYTWVAVDGDEATIGFTSYSLDRMEEMVAIELRPVGDEIKQAEPCGTVDVMKALIDIPAPLSGIITVTNPRVIDDPDLTRSDTYGEGWLLKVRITNQTEIEGLLSAGEYEARAGG